MASHRGEAYKRQVARNMMGKETPIRQGVNIKIENKIKRIKDTFDLIRERDSRNVLFARLIRLFNAIKKHLSGATEDEIALHILSIMKKIKKTVGTLLKKTEVNKIRNTNYAQAVYWGAAAPKIEYPQAVEPPKKNSIKEKQLLICIINITEAEIIYKLFIRALIERITANINNK